MRLPHAVFVSQMAATTGDEERGLGLAGFTSERAFRAPSEGDIEGDVDLKVSVVVIKSDLELHRFRRADVECLQ